jgi:anti-anti-sigma factor
MSITTQLNADATELTITIGGRFDFNLHQQFRDVIEPLNDNVECYIVDLKDSDYMDSAALGMLLLLLEKAGNEKERVRLINPNQTIQKILEIANFHILFDIVTGREAEG